MLDQEPLNQVEVGEGVWILKEHALFLEEEETVVVADLHLGFEGALREEGISIPKFQKAQIVERLGTIIDRFEPRTLVVNGDFKHEFSRNLRDEWEEVLEVLDFLETRVKPVMIRGNHDNFLQTILSKRGLKLQKSLNLAGMTLVHGHEVVPTEGRLVIGHEHPILKLTDEVGASLRIPCFLVSDEVVVLPAMSPLALGSDIIGGPRLSPLLENLYLGDAKIYGIDNNLGILEFGRLRDLARDGC